jgi:hypothetical protein
VSVWGYYEKKPFGAITQRIQAEYQYGDFIAHTSKSTLEPFLYYLEGHDKEQFSLIIPDKLDSYWKQIMMRGVKRQQDMNSCVGEVLIKEIGEDEKFYPGMRIWLVSSSWQRDGAIEEHSLAVRERMMSRFRRAECFVQDGVYVDLFLLDAPPA